MTHNGLSNEAAEARMRLHGPNALPERPPTPLWRRFARQFQSPLIYILLFALVADAAIWVSEGATGLPVESIAIAVILVLAFGRREGEGDEEIEFLGLALLWDPPRPEVPDAIKRAQEAGIRVVMVTGDHPAAALAVAHEVGIRPSRVLTGLELETMPAEALGEAVREANRLRGARGAEGRHFRGLSKRDSGHHRPGAVGQDEPSQGAQPNARIYLQRARRWDDQGRRRRHRPRQERARTKRQPQAIVIMITGNVQLEDTIAALRGGAYDFIGKPVRLGELQVTIRNGIEAGILRREVRLLRREQERRFGFDQIIGESPAMAETIRLARKVAASGASSVLLLGESGTGKDLVAKAIHYGSSRADQPFIAINCAAIPATLIESELFGHEKGAFTDAKGRKEGLFEQAQGGTLFLDEIGELELGLQAKLLRVLEEGSFRRVGGLKDLPLDSRYSVISIACYPVISIT